MKWTDLIKPTLAASLNVIIMSSLAAATDRAYNQTGDYVALSLIATLAFIFRVFLYLSDPDNITEWLSAYHIFLAGRKISATKEQVLKMAKEEIDKDLSVANTGLTQENS
jgi:hypothetical protein